MTRLWPTPNARDPERLAALGEMDMTLPRAVATWPTPTSRDHKDTGDSIQNGTVPVNGAVGPSTAGGALNPTWVEWLMGFPLGWTDSGASATPSSRRSSSSSGGASSKRSA